MTKRTGHSEPEPATDHSEDQVDDQPCCERADEEYRALEEFMCRELPRKLLRIAACAVAGAGMLAFIPLVVGARR